jgi:hypothetical protein
MLKDSMKEESISLENQVTSYPVSGAKALAPAEIESILRHEDGQDKKLPVEKGQRKPEKLGKIARVWWRSLQPVGPPLRIVLPVLEFDRGDSLCF